MAKFIIKNLADIRISESYFRKINHYLEIDDKTKIKIVFSNDILPDQSLAAHLPLDLKRFGRSLRELCDFDGFITWSHCIAVSKKICDLSEGYPAYFTYNLGHELGHVKIYEYNPKLSIFCMLIFNFLNDTSIENKIELRKFPNEQYCDAYSKFLISNIYGEKQFISELEKIVELNLVDEDFEYLKNLNSNNDFSNLKDEMMSLASPYKNELLQLWKTDFESRGEFSLASVIKNFDEVFNPESW